VGEELEILFDSAEATLHCSKVNREEYCYLRLNEKLIPKRALRRIEEKIRDIGFTFADVWEDTVYYRKPITSPREKREIKELARLLEKMF